MRLPNLTEGAVKSRALLSDQMLGDTGPLQRESVVEDTRHFRQFAPPDVSPARVGLPPSDDDGAIPNKWKRVDLRAGALVGLAAGSGI